MSAGDFSASAMNDVVVRATEIWQEPRSMSELRPQVQSAKTALQNQLVQIIPIMQGDTCIGVKSAWLKSCDDTVVDLTSSAWSDCVITGSELESDNKVYGPTYNKVKSFTVWDEDCKDIYDVVDKIAYGQLKAKAALRKDLNATLIAYLQSNRCANEYSDTLGSIPVGTPTVTEFTSAYWNEDLIAEFDLIREFNLMSGASYLISGTNLRNAEFNAKYNAANADGKDEILKLGHFPISFDPLNVDSTAGAKSTFMVDPSAMAWFSWNQYQNEAPENKLDPNNTHVWKEYDPEISFQNGPRFEALSYDVEMQRLCKVSGAAGVRHSKRYGWAFNYILRGGFILGPGDCNGGTGIQEFRNVESYS